MLLIVGGSFVGLPQAPAAAATPTVTVTPTVQGATNTSVYSGEVVVVSVGANSLFTPGAKVNILECADPAGTVAALPTSISNCDGNTIQGATLLVQSNGSVVDDQYTLYQLPNAVLGEQSNAQPVCNGSNQCVLYVGEDQNDFTQPKLFSAPFAIGQAPDGSSSGSSAVSIAPPTSLAASDGSAATGALALTGVPEALPWLILLGVLCILVGSSGRRLVGAHR